MKVCVSLTDPVVERANALASAYDSNLSTVVEAALHSFEAMPDKERVRIVRQTHGRKRALTRTGWMSVFWEVLGEEFGIPDGYRGTPDHVYAARTYDGYYVIFLRPHANESEGERDDLIVHIFEVADENASGHGITKHYKFEHNVYDAARETYRWIREHPRKKARRAG